MHSRSPIESLAEIWRRRKWLLILPFIMLFLVLCSLILALPPLYKSSTVVIFGQDDISESVVTSAATSNELEQRLEVVRQSILSRSHLQQVIEEFNLYPNLREEASAEGLVRRMRKDVSITQEKMRQPEWGQQATFAVTITYQGWDPKLVADVTNNLAERFQVENEGIRTRQASRTAEFLREELESARDAFLAQERRIEAFKNTNLGGLPQQESMNLAALERINSELRLNGERQIQLMSRRNDMLLGLTGGNGANASTAGSARVRLQQLKRQLADLGTRYTDNYPDIIRVRDQIVELERQIASGSGGSSDQNEESGLLVGYASMGQSPEEIEDEIIKLRIKEEELRNAFTSLQSRVENTPRVEQELQQLTNDYNEARQSYLTLQSRYQDASLAESLEYQQNQQVQVLEYAIPPEMPAAPDRNRLLIMIFMLSAGAGVGLVFVAEQMDRTFHTLDDIRGFTKLPVLGSISRITTTRDKVRTTTRSVLITIAFIAALIILSTLAFELGQSRGQQIMWMMN